MIILLQHAKADKTRMHSMTCGTHQSPLSDSENSANPRAHTQCTCNHTSSSNPKRNNTPLPHDLARTPPHKIGAAIRNRRRFHVPATRRLRAHTRKPMSQTSVTRPTRGTSTTTRATWRKFKIAQWPTQGSRRQPRFHRHHSLQSKH